MTTTVVALDQSPEARNALDWALSHGDTETRYVLVTVLPAALAGQGFPPPARHEWLEAEKLLQQDLDEAIAHTGRADVKAECEVRSGSPAAEVLEATRRHNADHLVLGARGQGGFARLLLGSVASAAIHHAPCPVTVVPLARERGWAAPPADPASGS